MIPVNFCYHFYRCCCGLIFGKHTITSKAIHCTCRLNNHCMDGQTCLWNLCLLKTWTCLSVFTVKIVIKLQSFCSDHNVCLSTRLLVLASLTAAALLDSRSTFGVDSRSRSTVDWISHEEVHSAKYVDCLLLWYDVNVNCVNSLDDVSCLASTCTLVCVRFLVST